MHEATAAAEGRVEGCGVGSELEVRVGGAKRDAGAVAELDDFDRTGQVLSRDELEGQVQGWGWILSPAGRRTGGGARDADDAPSVTRR